MLFEFLIVIGNNELLFIDNQVKAFLSEKQFRWSLFSFTKSEVLSYFRNLRFCTALSMLSQKFKNPSESHAVCVNSYLLPASFWAIAFMPSLWYSTGYWSMVVPSKTTSSRCIYFENVLMSNLQENGNSIN